MAAILITALAAPVSAAAAPRPPEPSSTPSAIALGGGAYEMIASVFGTRTDGLVGNETASGHILQRNDRLVALPACTESSCPWLTLSSGVGDEWGPQTRCAEDDGLCWVQVVSLDTGRCAVAPVLDLGPLFIRDNWWAPSGSRSYRLAQGILAAEIVREGGDVGFGRGISDRGYDVEEDFWHGPGIDLAAGTWTDLGLPVAEGVTGVRVTLLWQAGVDHEDACGGGSGGNATVAESLNLRAGPNTGSAVLDVMPAGSRVSVLSGATGGFYQLRYANTSGWAHGDFLRPDGGRTGTPMGVVSEDLNLRMGPSTGDAVLDVMPAGSLVRLRGSGKSGFLPVVYGDVRGWAFADFLDAGNVSAGSDGGGSAGGGRATVREDLNLRAGPSTGDDVLAVMPAGATVSLTGDRDNGFVSISYRNQRGWAYAEYLDGAASAGETAIVKEDLNLRDGPSLGDDVLDVMPAGAEVTLTGDSRAGYVSVSYGGRQGWAAAAYLTTDGGPLPAAVRTVTEDLNLRAGPSAADRVLRVMPAGDRVVLTGPREDGYVAVTHNGRAGWAHVKYLE